MSSTTIQTLDHAFASVFHDIATGAKAILSWEQRKVQPDAVPIEALSTLIPVYGPEIAIMERLSFAALGAVAAAWHVNGKDVQKTATANPSLSSDLLTATANFLQLNPSLITQAENLVKSI